MSNHRWFALILPVIVFRAAGACDETDLYRVWSVEMNTKNAESTETKETGRRVLRIRATEEQLEKAPVWVQGKEPPLLPDEARRRAMNALGESGKNGRFEKIHLEPYPCTRANWFYIVWYFPSTRNDFSPFGHFIGVLLDGTVLLPARESEGDI